jgi:TonB family protein
VENVRVLRSIPLLDNSAITAVKKWKYKPALQHGRPVKVFFTVVVTFSLR